MAFSVTLVNDRERSLKDAYVRAVITYADMRTTSIQCKVWESAEMRAEHPTIPDHTFMVDLPTQADVPCNNPIEYVYLVLEASGKFPEATWNV